MAHICTGTAYSTNQGGVEAARHAMKPKDGCIEGISSTLPSSTVGCGTHCT